MNFLPCKYNLNFISEETQHNFKFEIELQIKQSLNYFMSIYC